MGQCWVYSLREVFYILSVWYVGGITWQGYRGLYPIILQKLYFIESLPVTKKFIHCALNNLEFKQQFFSVILWIKLGPHSVIVQM